jgi:hypothetical protein
MSEAGMGVYAVHNLVDGAVYVGSAADIDDRWADHRVALERACHPNDALQAAWVRLGAGAFELVILENVSCCEELAPAEQRWIDRYSADGVHRVYNAQSRAIRRPRTPLNLDQAARRLHLSTRQLLRWVQDGRVPCHYTLARSSPEPRTGPMTFDRDELDAIVRRPDEPAGNRLAEIVVRLRALRHRVDQSLHVGA